MNVLVGTQYSIIIIQNETIWFLWLFVFSRNSRSIGLYHQEKKRELFTSLTGQRSQMERNSRVVETIPKHKSRSSDGVGKVTYFAASLSRSISRASRCPSRLGNEVKLYAKWRQNGRLMGRQPESSWLSRGWWPALIGTGAKVGRNVDDVRSGRDCPFLPAESPTPDDGGYVGWLLAIELPRSLSKWRPLVPSLEESPSALRSTESAASGNSVARAVFETKSF